MFITVHVFPEKAHVDETDPFSFRALRGSSNRCSHGFLDSVRLQAGEHVRVYGGTAIGIFSIQLTRFRGEHVPVVDCAYGC
jgi:hypothetical protein